MCKNFEVPQKIPSILPKKVTDDFFRQLVVLEDLGALTDHLLFSGL
jgi:hypothetical protein